MGFLKQLLVTIVVLALAGAAWLKLDPNAGRTVLNAGFDVPPVLRDVVLALSPGADEPETVAGAPGGPPGGARRAPLVVTAPVAEGRTRTSMRALGTGEAVRSVTVYPEAVGILQSVPVKSGDSVKAGEVLAKLESANEEVALAQARINLDGAEEKLARVQRLQASNAITAVEVRDNLRLRDTARLELQSAEIALEKRAIVAPIDGRIGIVEVDTGDLVGSTTLIATIDDRSRIKVIFYTPEEYVQGLSLVQPVTASSTALPARTYTGTITAIDSRLDVASRTLRTEATLENADDALRPGMSFTIAIEARGESYFATDPLAVVWERTGPIVWKVVDGKARKAKVSIVERNIDQVLVASQELKVGDAIVVEGLQSVREGAPVEVEGTTPATVPAAPPSADAGGTRPDRVTSAGADAVLAERAAASATAPGQGSATGEKAVAR